MRGEHGGEKRWKDNLLTCSHWGGEGGDVSRGGRREKKGTHLLAGVLGTLRTEER